MESLKIKTQEKEYDPFLESLWREYNFPGTPPVEGSQAEIRLKDLCGKYALYVEAQDPVALDRKTQESKMKSSELERRNIHNQIAMMVIGKQRSGLVNSEAEYIGEFAFEYSRGYKIKDIDKFQLK